MGRTLKFDTRKTHSCTTKVHSDVATRHDDDGTLVVTVPRASYTTAILTDSIQLHRRLMHCSMSLLAEWICSVVATTNLALYKLSITPPVMSAEFTFMLTIQPHDAWTLGTSGRRELRASTCPLLAQFPSKLLSVQETVSTPSVLDTCKLCIGNPDEKFKALSEKHHGSFKNRSGIMPV